MKIAVEDVIQMRRCLRALGSFAKVQCASMRQARVMCIKLAEETVRVM